ncbi:hypothetical protein ABK040_002462 [Willaertia magna]
MFGLIVPTCPCFMDFQQVAENRWIAQIPDRYKGQKITEMTLFILPNSPLIPQEMGFTIYLSNDAQNWEYIDYLSSEKQSTHIHVPLSFDNTSSKSGNLLFQNAFQNVFQQQQEQQNFIFIGLSIDSMDVINNLSLNAQQKQQLEQSQVQQLVQFIAKDLFNYMSSFAKPVQGFSRDMLVLPTNVIDQWLQKFLQKLKHDPHIYKKQMD